MADSPNIALTYLEENQANSEVAVNSAFNRLDMLLKWAIVDRDLATPPGSPTNGDVYLVATSGTGAWATHDGELAGYYDGWIFQTVAEGRMFRVLDENIWIGWDGAAWKTFTVT